MIKESRRARRKTAVNFLIDSGAVYSSRAYAQKAGDSPLSQSGFRAGRRHNYYEAGWGRVFRVPGRGRGGPGDFWRERRRTVAGRDYAGEHRSGVGPLQATFDPNANVAGLALLTKAIWPLVWVSVRV